MKAGCALALTGSLLMPTLAQAETTGWVDNDGGRMRLIVLPAADEGTYKAVARVALEIEPKPGWITYWREPGASGIPPRITASAGVNVWAPHYPPPKILKLGDYTDIGYDGPVTLPFKLDPLTGPAEVEVFIGLCQKICIPFQARFSLSGQNAAATPEEVALVERAEAAIAPDQSETFQVTAMEFTADTLALGLALPVEKGKVEVIATGPEGFVFTGTAEAAGKEITVNVPLTGFPKGQDPKATDWRFVVKIGDQAIETEIQAGD